MSRNAIILNTIARTMNAGGSAIVSVYDAGASAFNSTMSALSPGERTKLGGRIKTLEKQIRSLSLEIAKETSRYPDPAAALESEPVIARLNNIRELDKEIAYIRQRIAEIDEVNTVKKPQRESTAVPGFFAQSLSRILPGEKAGCQNKIFSNEKKIHELYCEFAKESSKQPDPSAAINSAAVAGIIAKINELKAENSALKLRIADMAKTKAEKTEKAAMPKAVEKKPQPESSGVAKFFIHAITDTISGYLPGEKSDLEHKLAEHEKNIQNLYLEVAKESAKYPDPADAITSKPIIGLIAKINELKAEIVKLNQRKAEITVVQKTEKTTGNVITEKTESVKEVSDKSGHAINIQTDNTQKDRINEAPEKQIELTIAAAGIEVVSGDQGAAAEAVLNATNTGETVIVDVKDHPEAEVKETVDCDVEATASLEEVTVAPETEETYAQVTDADADTDTIATITNTLVIVDEEPSHEDVDKDTGSAEEFTVASFEGESVSVAPASEEDLSAAAAVLEETIETGGKQEVDDIPISEPLNAGNEAEQAQESVKDSEESDAKMSTAPAVSRWLSANNPLEYIRTKLCTIPNPTQQPPTIEDIEAVTRGMHADDAQKFRISEILKAHSAVTVAAPITDDGAAETQEADTDNAALDSIVDEAEIMDKENPYEAEEDDTGDTEELTTTQTENPESSLEQAVETSTAKSSKAIAAGEKNDKGRKMTAAASKELTDTKESTSNKSPGAREAAENKSSFLKNKTVPVTPGKDNAKRRN